MTKEKTITNIEKYMLHRYENILVDTVKIPDADTIQGSLELNIPTNDPLNRTLFFKDHLNQQSVLNISIYMEILALAGIVILQTAIKDKPNIDATIIFATISNFEKLGHYPVGSDLKGNLTFISSKKGFTKFSGTLETNSSQICKGTICAFEKPPSTPQPTPTASDITFPTITKTIYSKTNRHKPDNMILCDTITKISSKECLSTYTYPDSHPLTKGHFPSNPIMMGVMQWMAIEDALCAFLEQEVISGNHEWTLNASIYNQDKIKIADLSRLKLESWINEPHIKNQTEIKATHKINFRRKI